MITTEQERKWTTMRNEKKDAITQRDEDIPVLLQNEPNPEFVTEK